MAEFGGDALMPIAVIGMGCRFPGDATSPNRLWELLVNGRNAWSEFPKDRINIDGFYHPSGDRQGSICFKGGHFLRDDVAAWDAPFFSTTSHEAAAMDPQQRILLEVSYEAFENAGIVMESLPGSATAVYCGSFVKDYEQVVLRDPDYSPQYAATGNGIAIMSNRISWFYDLKGPSMTLDTGCSASLVGVHLACQSLRTRESTMAIAMGAGLILTPSTMMPMTALNFLSPDGKCFTFDERANGYGRGEGIGAVILKPLEAALKDNDTIRAVIRGSGVNQDGRTPGITMPSKDAQAMNIRAVYEAAGLGYGRTAYFEAHGTGTQAGDPTELGAISETFAETRNSEDPIFVGSVKTNIGHLEGCAGIAGLVKGVLMLENGLIPPNLYFEKANPKIDLDAWKIKIPTSLTPWPLDGLRRVSINCFGFGGTNAHIILDDALHYLSERNLKGNHLSVDSSHSPTPSEVDSWTEVNSQNSSDLISTGPQAQSIQSHKLYVLSSHEENGLYRLSTAYSEYLQAKCISELFHEEAEQLCSDLAYTLSCRRSKLPWKSFLVSGSVLKLVSQIQEEISKPFRSSQIPNIAFVFSGQGAQWFGMGRELLQYERFAKSLQEADTYLRSIGCEWSLMTELLKDEHTSIINLPRISQPLCTALQIALIDLLEYWKIVPRAVIGHSSGEIAAAYALGVVSREDSLKLAFHRGRLTSAIKYLSPTFKGRMIAVALPKETAENFIENLKSGMAVVACINSPENVTVSGDENAILELDSVLAAEGVFARLLKVENAYHSSHMKVIERHYLHSIQDIQVLGVVSGRKMFSSVTGMEVDGQDLGPEYWARNLVSPVNFSKAMNSLLHSNNAKPDILLELGPHAVLQAPVKQILDADTKPKSRPISVSMLYRGKDAIATSLEAVGHLWAHGYPANLELVNKSALDENPSVLADLPTYPWNHTKTYWHESHLGSDYRFRKHGREDLIGAPTVEGSFFEPRWRGFIRVSENPWVQDHQVQNTIIYPAAGMIAMAIEGARQIQDEYHQVEGYEILHMSIDKAMLVPSSAHGLETALNMKRHECKSSSDYSKVETFDFTIYSQLLGATWQKNCNGLLNIQYKYTENRGVHDISSDTNEYLEDYLSHQKTCTETFPARQLYEALESIGMKYGPTFQNITSIQKKDNVSCTTVRIPDTKTRMPGKYEYPHLIHPATLDAMFQTVFVAGNEPMVPSHLDSLFISADFPDGAGAELRGYSTASRKGFRDAVGNIAMSNGSWDKPKLIVKGLHFTALSTAAEDTTERGFLPNHHNLCAEIVWKEDITTAKLSSLSQWIELASYKNPSMNVLDTCCGTPDSSVARLKLLGGKSNADPQFLKYTFMNTSGEDLELDRNTLEHWRDHVDFKSLDPVGDLTKQGFKARSFDLIFLDTSDSKFCESVSGLLKPSGRFVLVEPIIKVESARSMSEDQMSQQHSGTTGTSELEGEGLLNARVFQLDVILRDDMVNGNEVKVFNRECKATREVPLASCEVLILFPVDPSPKLQDLAMRLKEALLLAGAKISSSIITGPTTSFSSKLCLALLEVDSPFISNWTEDEFHIFRSMISDSKGCLWITKGGQMNANSPFSAPITALFRTIRSEDPQKAIITLDLGAETDLSSDSTSRAILSTFLKSFDPHEPSNELEYAEHDGKLFIPRVILDEHLSSRIERDGKSRDPRLQQFFQPKRPLQLEVGTLGKLDSLHFNNDTSVAISLDPRDVEIRVQAVGVNQVDVKTALGQTTFDTIGSDVSGIVVRVGSDVSKFNSGDRVVTIVPGAIKTFVRSHDSTVQTMPDEMSFETAASLPTDFTTAYYSIITVGRLQEGESILINGGTRSFVRAALQIAKHIGAEMFAVAPRSEERTIFLETCGIPDDHVFDSSLSLSHKMSQARKFNLILNSSTGSLRTQAWGYIQEYGRFIDIDTQGLQDSSSQQIPHLANVTYSKVDLNHMIRSNTPLISRLIKSTFEMIKDGLIRQITPLKTFSFSEISAAFQGANNPEQMSHIVLKANDNDIVPVIPRDEHPLNLSPTATYVLAGGLGGLGRSLAHLLVTHGAKNLAFISRSGAVSSAQVSFLSSLKSQHINAQIYKCDICDATQLSNAIKQCSDEMPPIRGVIQGAAVVRDAIFENMAYEDWISATQPKIQGSWNLHSLLPQDLDFFVFLSSSAGVIGARGQANYAAGNAFQDSLAHHRRKIGMKAVSLDLGPILGVGMVAEDEATLDILRRSGFIGIREKYLHILMIAAMTGYTQDGNVTPAQVIVGTGTGGMIKQNAVPDPYWHNSPMFSIMRGVDLPPPSSDGSSDDTVFIQNLLSASTSFEEATGVVAESLAQLFAKSMNMLAGDLDTGKPANAYGVDSLVAVGTRNWIFRETGVDVSVFEILSENSIGQLAERIAKVCRFVAAELKEETAEDA